MEETLGEWQRKACRVLQLSVSLHCIVCLGQEHPDGYSRRSHHEILYSRASLPFRGGFLSNATEDMLQPYLAAVPYTNALADELDDVSSALTVQI